MLTNPWGIHMNKLMYDFRSIGPERRKEWWKDRLALERTEGVRRCFFCGARQDLHNLPADMAHYGYEAHDFEYATGEELQEWGALYIC